MRYSMRCRHDFLSKGLAISASGTSLTRCRMSALRSKADIGRIIPMSADGCLRVRMVKHDPIRSRTDHNPMVIQKTHRGERDKLPEPLPSDPLIWIK
jgi:hypothetical protein